MSPSKATRAAVLVWLVAATGVATGCGASADAPRSGAADAEGPMARVESRSAAPAVTDGRLGDATAGAHSEPAQELSGGGPLDATPAAPAPDREGVGATDACPDADVEAAPGNLGTLVAATTCLLNGERRDRGLVPLSPSAPLLKAASVHARDMVAHSYFSHTGRDGSQSSDRIRAAGYLRGATTWLVGENLAWGSGALSTPRIIMRAWMNSPGHRENVLDAEYRDLGVAVVAGNPETADGTGATYVTEFGSRSAAAARRARRTKGSPAASRAKARRSARRDHR